MLVLTLDTATPWGRFAVADAGALLAYRPHNVNGSYADAILPLIDQTLADAGRRLDEVRVLGVTDGPGSFTGVRLGVATAKGLAYALGCELATVSTLAAMAAALLAEHTDRELAVPVLDARRGEVFAGVFRRAGAWVEPVREIACLGYDVWWQRLVETVPELQAPIYGGSGVSLLVGQGADLRQELRHLDEPVTRAWTAAHPATARALAVALADDGLRSAAMVHPFALTPRYLRASDAEVLREVDLTPSRPSDAIDFHASRSRNEERP